jgi:integrase
MMAELKKWKLACAPNSINLIFQNEAGGPINHNNMINRHLLPALKKANIGKIRVNDLRHTHASLLIMQGENPKYIQKQMGQSKVSTTLDI